MSERLRHRSRHLFLPYVPFTVSVLPHGDGTPSYLEKAALFLVEGRDRARNPLPIDELIIQLALGEPAGRELINGLWRKGWIVINGREGTLHLSQPMQSRISKDGTEIDFLGLGTGELPIQKRCCFDVITGRVFVSPPDRRNEIARPPFVIQPFHPESDAAPYGLPMLGYLDLDQKDLVEALRVYDEFRQLLATSHALTVKVVPPERIPSQRDLQFLRLFFQVERDQNNRFTLRSAENRHPGLAQLGASVAGPVSERVLNVNSQLRAKFLEEEPVTEGRRPRPSRGAVGQLQRAAERFGQVERAHADAALESYNEARLITQQGLSLIQGMLRQVASRQITFSFLPGRQQIDGATSEILRTFRRQAILTSQTAELEQLNRRISEAEAVPAEAGKRVLLIQTAGRMNTDRTNTMRRAISRLRSLASNENSVSTQVFPKFSNQKDGFVDTPLLIGDADDLLLSSANLLDSPSVPATGFWIKFYAPSREAVGRERSSTLNAANDVIDAIYPTFFAPSPFRNVHACKPAPKTTEESPLQRRLTSLLSDLAAEAVTTTEAPDDSDVTRQLNELNVAQARELSKLRMAELRTIGDMLQDYEKEIPVIATGLSDTSIFEAGCELLLNQDKMKPFYVGIRPNDIPDPEFIEVIETLFKLKGCQEGHLVFLGEPNENWKTLESKWQVSYQPKLTIHAPKSAKDAQRMATFMPFIIGTAGCLVASGGIAARTLVAPRRKDKTQVGVELKGRECHAAPLEMLAHLLPQELERRAEDFRMAARGEGSGFLSSTLYRRWLQCTASPVGDPTRSDAASNLGAPVLVDRFRTEPELYEKCLADAKFIGNYAYEKAVVKASVLAELQSRDAYAAWLWEAGRIFEASVFAHDVPQEHPLADPALRALVCDLSLPRSISNLPEIKREWLGYDEVLALIALNLLHPVRRLTVAEALPDKFPQGPLGAFAEALLTFARASGDEPLIWTQSDGPKLAYAPATYSEILRTSLYWFEKDRGNRESNDIQALARERFEPLSAMRKWINQNRASTPADIAEAIRVLTREYGADYAIAIGTKGKRENIARDLVEELAEISRSKNPLRREFIAGKKKGMIASISRFLEVLGSLAALGHDNGVTRSEERSALHKAAALWLKTAPVTEDVTPQSLLSEVARSSGRIAPNGEVDFALWRYPKLLDALRKSGVSTPSRQDQDLAAAILGEEWSATVGSAAVFEHLFHSGRYTAAEYILDICDSLVSLANNAEATQENAQRRLELTDRMDQEARELVEQARRLELDASQLGLVNLQEDARTYSELFLGLHASARDVEEGQHSLSQIRAKINAGAVAGLTQVIDQAAAGPAAFVNELVQSQQIAPWSRLLALAHYNAPLEAFATARPQASGSVGAMQSRLRDFNPRGDFNPRHACDHLRITRSAAAIRLLDAAKFSLCGRSHATDEELNVFVRELDALVGERAPATATLSIDQPDDNSGSARIRFPGGGLAAWLDWQIPEYELRILFSEQVEDRTLDQMGLAGGPLPVFINPFRLAPRIEGNHLLINLSEILAALTMARPRDALWSAVVQRTALATLVPWGDSVAPDEKARHLARLIGIGSDEVMRRLPPDVLASALRRLLDRLRIELTLEPRSLFESVEVCRMAANHCIAFMCGGHILDAFDIIWRTRLRGHGGPSVLPVNGFLSGPQAEAELRQQAANNFARWQARQPGEKMIGVPEMVARACVEIWTIQPTVASWEQMMRHLSERIGLEDRLTPELLGRWMIHETILIDDGDGRLQPNPAHPFASIRL